MRHDSHRPNDVVAHVFNEAVMDTTICPRLPYAMTMENLAIDMGIKIHQ